MPLINVRTSLPQLEQSDALLKALSAELARQTGKPERYVMALLENAVPMRSGVPTWRRPTWACCSCPLG